MLDVCWSNWSMISSLFVYRFRLEINERFVKSIIAPHSITDPILTEKGLDVDGNDNVWCTSERQFYLEHNCVRL